MLPKPCRAVAQWGWDLSSKGFVAMQQDASKMPSCCGCSQVQHILPSIWPALEGHSGFQAEVYAAGKHEA